MTKEEFQKKLSTMLNIILSLAVYINNINYQVEQSYDHKKLGAS